MAPKMRNSATSASLNAAFQTTKATSAPTSVKGLKSGAVSTTKSTSLKSSHSENSSNRRIHETALKRIGAPIIHGPQSPIDTILKVWDLDEAYGPACGLTRLERWDRAEMMGLAPPKEIKEILTGDDASQTQREESLFHGTGI